MGLAPAITFRVSFSAEVGEGELVRKSAEAICMKYDTR
jgi:hypothetical protein